MAKDAHPAKLTWASVQSGRLVSINNYSVYHVQHKDMLVFYCFLRGFVFCALAASVTKKEHDTLTLLAM